MSNMTKGAAPDGAKIKKLRKEAGMTQKGLVSGTVVMLRTLQRAEQGKAILPEMLGGIAASLGVDIDEIRLNAGKDQELGRQAVRLRRLASPSASNLVQLVQDGVDRMDTKFDLDPDESTAELLAEVAELSDEIWKSDPERYFELTGDFVAAQELRLTPAQWIRRIGRLNTMLHQLADACIWPFLGAYTQWQLGGGVVRGPAGDFNVHMPYMERILVVQFSSIDADYVTKNIKRRHWEDVEKEAIRLNEKENVPAEYIEQNFNNPFVSFQEREMLSEFLEKYRKTLNDRRNLGGPNE